MGKRGPTSRPYIPDLNQPALPDLNYPPPPHYQEEQSLPQLVVNVDDEGSIDTTAASKPKTVEEPETHENTSYWSKMKKALNRSLSRLSTIIKDAPAE